MTTNTKLIQQAIEDIHAEVVVHHTVSTVNQIVTLYYFDSREPTSTMKRHDININVDEYRELYTQPAKHGPSWNSYFVERVQPYQDYACYKLISDTNRIIGPKVYPQPKHEYVFMENSVTRRLIYRIMVSNHSFKYSDYLDCANLARYINPRTKVVSYRYNDNCNKRTFDAISISLTVNCCEKTRQDMSQYINSKSKRITKFVWNLLENSKEFKKYNIPINFVEIRDIIFTRDNRLEYTFTLKGESKDVME